MTDPLDGRLGEAWAGERPNGAHINVAVARRGSPSAASAVTALASPRPGHVPFLACLAPGTVVRPVTVVVNKTSIDDESTGKMVWGAGQLGVAQGVLDAVAQGLIDPAEAGELVLLVALWIDAVAEDETAVRRATREAMRAALADAAEPPSASVVRALADRREEAESPYYSGS